MYDTRLKHMEGAKGIIHPQYQNINSPSLYPYLFYGISRERLLTYQWKFILCDHILNSSDFSD